MSPEIKDYLSFIAYEARNLLGRTCAIASTRSNHNNKFEICTACMSPYRL
jgi:hypothetical protein